MSDVSRSGVAAPIPPATKALDLISLGRVVMAELYVSAAERTGPVSVAFDLLALGALSE